MTYYRFPENKIWKAVIGIALYLLLILSRDTVYTMVLLGFNKAQFLMLGVIGLLGIAFLVVNRKNLPGILKDRRMIAVLISTAVILLPMLVKRDWQLMYFSILLCLYVAIFLSYFLSYREVAGYYVLILSFIAGVSLIANYLLKPMAEYGMIQAEILNYNDVRYFYNFGISFPHIWVIYYRNYGIFREPGVYQFFLILALYLNNYVVDWKKPWQLWSINALLAVTMVSTFSTAGVVELGLLAVIVFFDKGYYKNKKLFLAAVLAVLVGIGAIVGYMMVSDTFFYEIEEMVEKLFVINESSASRYGAIYSDLVLFLQNPFFGEKLASVLHSVLDNTTSTMILFAAFGIGAGLLNVAAWIALVWDKNRKTLINLALLVVLFMSFNTQNLTANIFFWLFPYMALTERGLPLLKRKKKA